MQFYRLYLNQPPTITLAHRYQTPHYEANFRKMPERCEITYIERGRILRETDTSPIIYDEGSIVSFSRREEMHLYSDAPLHCHFTFGFCTEREPELLTAEDVAAWKPQDHCVILPERVPPGKVAESTQKTIKKIISAYTSTDFGRYMELHSAVYHVFALLTEYSVSVAAASGAHAELQNQLYCRRAVQYISEHLSEKIHTDEIAAYTGVSYGYLSRIFRSCMGATLIEYCNGAKIQRVRELIASQKISLENAGAAVGIDDVKYLSRLFKKYSGITTVEYRELYHAPRKQGKMTPHQSTFHEKGN